MNNSKWLKVFRILSENSSVVKKCLIKNINDARLREFKIPQPQQFDQTFSADGIKDVWIGGPIFFKTIEWLEFPLSWEIPRTMRNENLAPFRDQQDIKNIQQIISQLGQLELELTTEKLLLYGHK